MTTCVSAQPPQVKCAGAHDPIADFNEFRRWPHFSEDEMQAVEAVLRSGRVNYWTGEECRLFEEEYAQALGVRHAISLSNGTAALELALWALGIQPGDEVITTSRTFIASASCAVMLGAVPVCADVDRDSQNITAETIRERIGPRTRAIIAVHLAGWPCDMDPILELAREHGLHVVEDCAQAHGALYKGRHVGSMGHVGTFSFCQDKIITTGGEGGLLVTNDTALYERAWERKDHGKGFDTVFRQKHAPGFRWLHRSFGTNLRMDRDAGRHWPPCPTSVARLDVETAGARETSNGVTGQRLLHPHHATHTHCGACLLQVLRVHPS